MLRFSLSCLRFTLHMLGFAFPTQHSSQLSECAFCVAAAPMHDFVHFTLENACVAAASAVRPDTAHINVAWQGVGMDSLVCSSAFAIC